MIKDKLSEVQHVVDALKINGYTDQFTRSCQSTIVSTNQSQTNRGLVTLSYIQGTSEKIAKTLDQFNINVAHRQLNNRWLHFQKKNLTTNSVKTYQQEWSIKSIVKTYLFIYLFIYLLFIIITTCISSGQFYRNGNFVNNHPYHWTDSQKSQAMWPDTNMRESY